MRRTPGKPAISTGLLVPILLFAGSACGGKGGGQEGFTPPPPEVTVLEIAPRNVALPLEYPGRVEGSREVEVRPRVSGILVRRTFEEGGVVKRGQPLFEIDPAPYRAEVQAAEASLAEEKARQSKAERELARLEPLVAEKAVSRKEYDAAIAEVEQSRATALSAEARLDKAKLDLSWTRVPAPIGGVTSRAPLSEGSLVGPDSLLTRISQVSPIWVRFSVSDEEQLALDRAIREKRIATPEQREVEIVLADGSVFPERGRLNFSDPMIDEQTGSIELRAELDNAEGRLVPGQFVRVRPVGVERANTILVPQRAVLQGQQGKYVMVVGEGDVAVSKPVTVGRFVGQDWVIESGLAAGDRLIVDGVVKVQPGGKVTIAAPGGEPEAAGTPAENPAEAPAN